jgi:hypothetical protein
VGVVPPRCSLAASGAAGQNRALPFWSPTGLDRRQRSHDDATQQYYTAWRPICPAAGVNEAVCWLDLDSNHLKRSCLQSEHLFWSQSGGSDDTDRSVTREIVLWSRLPCVAE